jgi:hypothetical protein
MIEGKGRSGYLANRWPDEVELAPASRAATASLFHDRLAHQAGRRDRQIGDQFLAALSGIGQQVDQRLEMSFPHYCNEARNPIPVNRQSPVGALCAFPCMIRISTID